MKNHQSSFTFMDILSNRSSFFCIIFACECYQVILNLESCSERNCILNNSFGLLFVEIKNDTYKSGTEPWENTCLIYDHLQILFLCWHLFPIMPVNIPILSEVNIEHFFLIYVLKCLFLISVMNIFIKGNNRSYIHQG
jgi:hypothetical protein